MIDTRRRGNAYRGRFRTEYKGRTLWKSLLDDE
jgi:hypothetical protein